MRVALELQPCCGQRSGIGNYTYELARRLKNRDGMEFCGNVFNFLEYNDNSQALAGITMPIRECRLLPYGAYRRLWNLLPAQSERLFRQEADLRVFFDYVVPPKIPGKTVTTIHDMSYLRFPDTLSPRNLRRLNSGVLSSVEKSERVVTISEFAKREVMELLGVPEEKIAIVSPAPSLFEGGADFGLRAEKYGIRRPYLLYVGTIEPRKNLLRLLKAFQLLQREEKIPHQLVLAGGSGWANKEICREAENTDNVVMTGYVPREQMGALYRNAEAFVFPSLYEGFGIPPLEAMHYGCPVICANAASLPEVVGDAAELVDPYDERSIAKGIYRLLSDAERASELVKQGRRQAEKYTWERSAQRLMDLCLEIETGQKGDRSGA